MRTLAPGTGPKNWNLGLAVLSFTSQPWSGSFSCSPFAPTSSVGCFHPGIIVAMLDAAKVSRENKILSLEW